MNFKRNVALLSLLMILGASSLLASDDYERLPGDWYVLPEDGGPDPVHDDRQLLMQRADNKAFKRIEKLHRLNACFKFALAHASMKHKMWAMQIRLICQNAIRLQAARC